MALAVDLFCGLRQAKLCRRANLFVEQLVTRRTKYPDHIGTTVRHKPPCAIALVARPVRDLNDPTLAASFAGFRQIWIPPTQPLSDPVLVRAPRVVNFLHVGFALVKSAALHLGTLGGASCGAITLVAVRRRNAEVRAADSTVTSGGGYVALLAAPPSADTALTLRRAVKLVRALSLKSGVTIDAKQIVHGGVMP